MTDKFIVRHQFRHIENYYVTSFFQTLYSTLVKNFPQYKFEIINDPSYENNGYGSIYSCMNFSIINPITENYIVVSFFDNWKYHFMKHLGWKPSKMRMFFYCGGFNYFDYFNYKFIEQNNPDVDCPDNIVNIYKPFFYSTYKANYDDKFTDLYNKYNIENSIKKLYFRGYLWDFRSSMIKDIKHPEILIIDKNDDNQQLSYDDYNADVTKYRAALSLPGGTEICNRDIECFAVGVPVIRPHIDINYPDPLIPNYHYISCFESCKYWSGNPEYLSYESFAKYVIYYWEQIKNNIEYLRFISKNARSWYVKNCTMNYNIKYILSQINLENL